MRITTRFSLYLTALVLLSFSYSPTAYAQVWELTRPGVGYINREDVCLAARYIQGKNWDKLEQLQAQLRKQGLAVTIPAGTVFAPTGADPGCKGKEIKIFGKSTRYWIAIGSLSVQKHHGIPPAE